MVFFSKTYNFKTYNKKKYLLVFIVILFLLLLLVGRLIFLMIYKADYYGDRAIMVRERERMIKAKRGMILDRKGEVLASNKSVCTVSIIHSQVKDSERVIRVLSDVLDMDKEVVRKKVEKISSIERIKSNVDKVIADKIRLCNLDGVMVDEDYKRFYPYDNIASTVLGFTGADNQGIIGLEVKYNKYLKGRQGKILTITTANGVEVDKVAKRRVEPEDGYNIRTSIDFDLQKYAHFIAYKALEENDAKSVKIILMSPVTGEIYAMVNAPEFNLNHPYDLNEQLQVILSEQINNEQLNNEQLNNEERLTAYRNEEVINRIGEASNRNDEIIKRTGNVNSKDIVKVKNALLNDMWRNKAISDTYEPGSTFKIITAASAFEEGVLNIDDKFFCPGYKVVEDRRIRCHKVKGHGAENFRDGIMNSCNPVFIDVGLRLNPKKVYEY